MDKEFKQITFDFTVSATEDIQPPKHQAAVTSAEQTVADENQVNAIPDTSHPALPDTTESIAPVKNKTPKSSTRGRRSLKDMDSNADLISIPPDEILFQKQYYPIGEVARMFRVNQSLLRFWEGEFSILKPRKNGKGDRYFRAQDVKHLQLIYDLLRRRKFTIEGAKDYLRNNKQTEDHFTMIQSLEKIRNFLLQLKASL